MELLCEQRALSLFSLLDREDAWGVNVQPYSGSPANFAVFTALLKPHDRIMGLDLPSGGHLTHGYQTIKRKVSATSVYFESMPYHISSETGLVDYEEMEKLAMIFKPKLLIAGASAYVRDWDYARMRSIADSVGAYLLADMAHISGLVATKQANNPFDYCDIVTSTTHKSLRGPRSGMIFYKSHLGDAINNAVFPSLQGGPHNHQIAALAVALKEASKPEFTNYIKDVVNNARLIAQELIDKGYQVVTDGTDNHIVLWDARPLGISGSMLEKVLDICDISTNKNTLYGDTSALNPGGIRLGTPAITTRGMNGKEDMQQIVTFLHRAAILTQRVKEIAIEKYVEQGKKCKMIDFNKALLLEEVQNEMKTLKQDVTIFATKFPLPGLIP
jgi:glycine hydroxymethyltransferase